MRHEEIIADDVTIATALHEHEEDSRDKFVSAKKAVRERYGRTIDHTTDAATIVDEDAEIGFDRLDAEATVTSTGRAQLRLVDEETAKEQVKIKLAAARKAFDMNVLKEPKTKRKLVPPPANDNEPAENWLLMEAINRIKELGERTRRKGAAIRLRELVDTAESDVLGLSVHRAGEAPSVDYDAERSASGKVMYEHGQTLDRKWREYSEKNGESDAKRHDGSVRTSKHSGPVSVGFDVFRDDPAAQRRLDAQTELEDLAAAVGPLWVPLMDAVCRNAGFTEIAARWGYAQPVVGSFAVMLALDVAAKHIEAYREAKNFRDFVETHGLPVTARRYKRAIGAKLAT